MKTQWRPVVRRNNRPADERIWWVFWQLQLQAQQRQILWGGGGHQRQLGGSDCVCYSGIPNQAMASFCGHAVRSFPTRSEKTKWFRDRWNASSYQSTTQYALDHRMAKKMTRAKFTREPTRAILMDLFSTGTDVPPLTDIHTKVKADDDFGCLIILDAVYKKRWLACWVYH